MLSSRIELPTILGPSQVKSYEMLSGKTANIIAVSKAHVIVSPNNIGSGTSKSSDIKILSLPTHPFKAIP